MSYFQFRNPSEEYTISYIIKTLEQSIAVIMMMTMKNCSCGMVRRQKCIKPARTIARDFQHHRLIMLQAEFEPVLNLGSDTVERSCACSNKNQKAVHC